MFFLKLAEVRVSSKFYMQGWFCSPPVLCYVATCMGSGCRPPLNTQAVHLWPIELLLLLLTSPVWTIFYKRFLLYHNPLKLWVMYCMLIYSWMSVCCSYLLMLKFWLHHSVQYFPFLLSNRFSSLALATYAKLSPFFQQGQLQVKKKDINCLWQCYHTCQCSGVR